MMLGRRLGGAFGLVFTLVGALGLASLGTTTAGAQAAKPSGERRIITTEGADYYGKDFDILKDVDLNICETACLADNRCQSFTLNQSNGWCFLKTDVGELRTVANAVSGRVVVGVARNEDTAKSREADLAFLPKAPVDEGRRLRLEIGSEERDPSLDNQSIADMAAAAQGGEAVRLRREVVKREPDNAAAWADLSRAAIAYQPDDYEEQGQNATLRTAAAVNAFVLSPDAAERAAALDLVAEAAAAAEDWKLAIKTYRQAVALDGAPARQAKLDETVASHGFRIVENTVDNNAANPRFCLTFSEELSASLINGDTVGDYVSVQDGDALPVTASGSQICVDGVQHGSRYRLVVRPGITAASGERLDKSAELSIYVRDRDPSVRFSGNAYVLPAGGEASIPVVTVNTDKVNARLLRIGDRELARTISSGQILRQFADYELTDIADNQGQDVWHGTVDVSRKTNEEVTTAIPLKDIVKELQPGVYILSAKADNGKDSYEALATQWFVLTDIGLTTFSAADGFHVFARSLGTADPDAGVAVELVAANNEVLGRATTDAEGYARFAPGLMRGTGGDRPAVLMARKGEAAAGNDFVFLDLTASPFDLTDRGVEGREPAGPLDVFLTTERGIYRTGETAHLTGLVRDNGGKAVEGLTLTGIATRPDGVEYERLVLNDQAAGGFEWNPTFPANAMRGAWRFAVHTDPKKPALAETSVLVDDFEPEKIDFDVTADAATLDPAAPPAVSVDARYLFGAPATGLAIEGETVVTPAAALPNYERYSFGLVDDAPTALRVPFTGAVTDESGKATVAIAPFDVPATTKPLEAAIQVRVTDSGGRPVERRISLPLVGTKARLGIRPLFDETVGEGEQAEFDVVAVGPDGARVGAKAHWVLNKVNLDFQWYSSNGSWNYEPIRSTERVADGDIDVGTDGPARLTMPVSWGGYELTITESSDAALPVSDSFDAGWYVAAKTAETPDILRVSLDKPRYRVGDEAVVHVEPRFAGKAEVLVMGENVVARTMIDVPESGADVRLPVTRDWGPGAYVTAVLYRPMDLEAKRMPGRAIGLAHASVDPGERALSVSIEAPEKTAPRGTVDVGVQVAGLTNGETAYLTLAAVDVGILNITSFTPPAPTEHYFGQRRLGVEIRDLYSRLIDRMQGAPGTVRSGGDAGASMVSPPPMDQLVALFSGVITADADGHATVPLDLPDFNGTLKVMVVAWSKTGVGEANADLIVRDPIVATVSQPRFLAPGDQSRIAIDLTHVEGPAGKVSLDLSGGEGVVDVEGDRRTTLDIAEKGHGRLLLPVTGTAIGDASFRLALTTPDGQVLTKDFTLPVRSNAPETVAKSSFPLAAKGGTLTLADNVFADFVPGTARATVTVAGRADFDVAGVVRALDKYPYGCTEQLTSRAMPLVYLDRTILAAGLPGGGEDVRERVETAIKGVLANQSSNGSFGLWQPDSGDLWLDAYVTDFLTRAQENGYKVPAESFTLALDNLRNNLAYLPESPQWEPVAYAYYVLARNGRAAIGDLRYTADNQSGSFPTPLSKAHLAAALALYGDRVRAETVFREAVSDAVKLKAGIKVSPDNYGTALRDEAAVLTLGLESKIDGVPLASLVKRVSVDRSNAGRTSTQEDVWSLLAAHALLNAEPPSLTIDGETHKGAYAASFDEDGLARPVTIANRGAAPVSAQMTLFGVPQVAPPAESNGYAITRSYYTLNGEEADPAAIKQGDRLVTVLEIQPVDANFARLIVDDPLPAGFEIDNPAILRGGDVAALDWLELTGDAAHTEFRSDRFIAAVNKAADDTNPLRFAYIVRAVSPGEFVHPAAIVEDMYQPERRGRTDEEHVSVVGPRR